MSAFVGVSPNQFKRRVTRYRGKLIIFVEFRHREPPRGRRLVDTPAFNQLLTAKPAIVAIDTQKTESVKINQISNQVDGQLNDEVKAKPASVKPKNISAKIGQTNNKAKEQMNEEVKVEAKKNRKPKQKQFNNQRVPQKKLAIVQPIGCAKKEPAKTVKTDEAASRQPNQRNGSEQSKKTNKDGPAVGDKQKKDKQAETGQAEQPKTKQPRMINLFRYSGKRMVIREDQCLDIMSRPFI